MSVPAPDSSSMGRISPDSGRMSPANDPQSYESQVDYRLEQFRAQNVEDFDKIKSVLEGILHPEQRDATANLPEWIKAHGNTLGSLADRAKQLGQSSQKLFIERVAKKIQEIERLSPRAKAELAIENRFSREIDKCLDFSFESVEDFRTFQNLFGALLVPFYMVNIRDYPLRFAEIYLKLENLQNNKDSTGHKLLDDYDDAFLLQTLLENKIKENLKTINGYTKKDKERIIEEKAYHNQKGYLQDSINDQIRVLPIRNSKDFDFNRSLFAHLLDPSKLDPAKQIVISDDLSKEEKERLEDLKERAESVHEFFENPELYAKPEHLEKFKSLMKESLERAIRDIDRLSDREKEMRIEHYDASKKEAEQGQAVLAQKAKEAKEKANSKNKTISEDQMIANMNPPTTQIQAILRSATLSEREGLTPLRNLLRRDLERAREYGVEDLFEGNSITNLANAQTAEDYIRNLVNVTREGILRGQDEANVLPQIAQRIGPVDEAHELLDTQHEVLFRQQASYTFPSQSQQPNDSNSAQISSYFDSSYAQGSDILQPPTSNQGAFFYALQAAQGVSGTIWNERNVTNTAQNQENEVEREQQVEIETLTPEAAWQRARNELSFIYNNRQQWTAQPMAEQMASLRQIFEDLSSNNDRISQLNEGPLIRTALDDLNLFLLHNQYPTEIPQNILDICNNIFRSIDLYE